LFLLPTISFVFESSFKQTDFDIDENQKLRDMKAANVVNERSSYVRPTVGECSLIHLTFFHLWVGENTVSLIMGGNAFLGVKVPKFTVNDISKSYYAKDLTVRDCSAETS